MKLFEKLINKIKEKKLKKAEIKRANEILLSFAVGNINTLDFYKMYQEDIALQDVLENGKIMTKYYKNVDKWGYDNVPAKVIWYNKLHNANLNCLDDRLEIFRVIKIYFRNKLRRKKKPVYKNEDVDLFNFLADVFPRYALLPNLHYDFIDYFLSFIPKGLSKTKTKKIAKEKAKELFKYEKYPPRWMQGCEWPIVGKTPLTFLYQDGYPLKDVIHYFFRNESTKEIIVIEQLD